MPWEKSFDVDQATRRAMTVFWRKGYDATSLPDLLEATGINRGSFYNAFGSKRNLFLLTLLTYDREERRAMLDEVGAISDPMHAITEVFDRMIAVSLADRDKRGCFLVNTALELARHDEQVAEAVRNGFDDLERFFLEQIMAAQLKGSIRPDMDPKETAKGLLSLSVGLRVMARGIATPADLGAIKRQALQLLT